MKIIILGSGVVGVATAYYAAKAGHEVIVLDRQPGPALETSFANAGEISPGYAAPVSTVMDESYKVAITRLGDRIRAAGTAELGGYNLKLREARRETILHSVKGLYPQGGDYADVKFWTGLRPMTPDGTPIIGPTAYKNLFLNTGHGTLGWTMACGSGQILADIVSGRKPEIDIGELSVGRYRGV